jgi:hypothetical protein
MPYARFPPCRRACRSINGRAGRRVGRRRCPPGERAEAQLCVLLRGDRSPGAAGGIRNPVPRPVGVEGPSCVSGRVPPTVRPVRTYTICHVNPTGRGNPVGLVSRFGCRSCSGMKEYIEKVKEKSLDRELAPPRYNTRACHMHIRPWGGVAGEASRRTVARRAVARSGPRGLDPG